MSRQLTVLDHIRIASPCTVPWSSMQGDDRTRHCGQCNLIVFNLSNMTRPEAEALIIKHQGRLCIGYFQRADGTILTSDCPGGLRVVRSRLSRGVRRVGAAIAVLSAGLYAIAVNQSPSERLRLRVLQPFDAIASWLEPPVQQIWGRLSTGDWTDSTDSDWTAAANQFAMPERNETGDDLRSGDPK